MCIDLQYYFTICGHIESGYWMCRNQYWNSFCASPFAEDEVVNDESCAWCISQRKNRRRVLDEMKVAEVIDLTGDEEPRDTDDNGEKKAQKKITDHYHVSKSKSVVAGPAKATTCIRT